LFNNKNIKLKQKYMGKAKKRITKGKKGTKDIGTAINKNPIIAQNHLFSL
jgi:hypothetical protein